METRLASFGNDLFDAIDQQAGRGCFITADVIQTHIAETAFFPVAPMGNGQLVPAAVTPQPVHGVEHIEERQISIKRQTIPGRRANLFKGDIRLCPVDQLHLACVISDEGTHQTRYRTLSLQVFDNRQNRPFPGIEGDVINKIE